MSLHIKIEDVKYVNVLVFFFSPEHFYYSSSFFVLNSVPCHSLHPVLPVSRPRAFLWVLTVVGKQDVRLPLRYECGPLFYDDNLGLLQPSITFPAAIRLSFLSYSYYFVISF